MISKKRIMVDIGAVSLRSAVAVLTALAAYTASPVLIGHFCYLRSPPIETILVVVIPLALGVAVFATRRIGIGLLLLTAAPFLNFGLTLAYHEWLHMDAFPSTLLGKASRERRFQINEDYGLALRKLEAETSDAQRPTTAPDSKSKGNENLNQNRRLDPSRGAWSLQVD